MKHTGVGGKRSEMKRAGIARRPPNRVSYEGRSKESLELSKLSLHLIQQKQRSLTLETHFGDLAILYQCSFAQLLLYVFFFFS